MSDNRHENARPRPSDQLDADGAQAAGAPAAGHVIADTADASSLQESTYPAGAVFPARGRGDGLLARKTERATHCPYKGDASYYSIILDGEVLENVAWSYEDPFPAMEQIRGRLAFYTDRIDVYEVAEAERRAH